jgi:hypothetical protein
MYTVFCLFLVYIYVPGRNLDNVSHFGAVKLWLDFEIQCKYIRLLSRMLRKGGGGTF